MKGLNMLVTVFYVANELCETVFMSSAALQLHNLEINANTALEPIYLKDVYI